MPRDQSSDNAMSINLKIKFLLTISCLLLIAFFFNKKYEIDYEWNGLLPDKLYVYPKIVDRRSELFASISEPKQIINSKCGNALIIGDSIAFGYTPFLREDISKIYNFYIIPDNGRSTSYSLKRLDYWLDGNSYDLIIANWGLWDILRLDLPYTNKILDQSQYIVTSQQDYKENLELIYKKLRDHSKNLIFINTTPTLPNEVRKLSDVIQYNKTMEEFVEENSLNIIDLHAYVKSNFGEEEYIDTVHFSETGNSKIADFLATKFNNCKN